MNREMVNSGIPWIGDIPKGWEIRKVKDAFVRKNEKAHQENPIVLSLARAGIKVRDISTNEGQMAESYYDYNPVEPYDLLVNPMDLYSGANCSMSLVSGVISPAYVNLRAKRDVSPRFYDYYFKTQYWSMAFFAHGKGVSFDNRWTLGVDTLFRYSIPFPSLEEQQKIASFLDRKCAEIDEMIALQEKIVEELKAYKQSVITEAVTKGLNPDVPMKDSGIEWIGEIPEHWTTIRIKYLLGERKERSVHGGEEPLSMSQKYGLIPTKEMDVIPNMASSFEGAKIVYVNDLVFNKLKAHLGVFSTSNHFGLVSPDYAVYYGLGRALMPFMEFMFKTPQYISEFRKTATGVGSGLTRLYTSDLFSMPFPLPSIEEQEEIVKFLEEKRSQIDNLISIKLSKIDSLKEYKKSIIYEYVTGKKEVTE